ncbi:MAG: glucose/arabinose dehydrogenase [Halioglobus sp.]|jgi:glucose/arabinose dehydrogenase
MLKRNIRHNFFLILSTLTLGACAQESHIEAAPGVTEYQLELVTTGVSIPWGMVWLNTNDLLVSDKTGELRLIRNGLLLDEKIAGLPEVDTRGQGGLLDVEIDPNYAENGWIYIAYSGYEGEGGGTNTSVLRARLDEMELVDKLIIFNGEPNSERGFHYGSRLEFDTQGYLYITLGDRGERDVNPQRLDTDAGKVHRIHADGSIPQDNPFVGQAAANASIFSYGHRNPQGMALHPTTGQVWTHEHGPKGGDEINILKKAANYGWPVITYGRNYSGTTITDRTHMDGMVQPQWQWTPSIAPSAMHFVTSARYPEWQGRMLVGSLKFQYLLLMEIDNDKVVSQTKIFEDVGRLRSISQSPEGYIYIGTDGNGIFKIVTVE